MTLDDARARLEALMPVNGTHQDYARVVALATLYRRLATGDVAPLMRRYVRRESKEDYDARVNMTTETVSSSFSELKTPYYTVARLGGASLTKRFDYRADLSPDEAKRRTLRLTLATDGYYNQKPLESFLADLVARSISFSDPNAWLLTTFGPFDFRTQTAQPYPVLLPCEAVVDFAREAGRVVLMTARLQVSAGMESGWRYTSYLDNEALDYWPVLYPKQGAPIRTMPGNQAPQFEVMDPEGRILWQGRAYVHGAGRVPASRVGYVPDEATDQRTMQSPLTPAIPYLLQMLKVGSESDIVMAQMASPIRVAYVAPCQACDGSAINSVSMLECGVCNGTGQMPISTSAQDTITMPLPKDARDLVVKPADLIHFAGPSSELPDLQLRYLDSRRQLAARAVGQAGIMEKVSVAQTATERMSQLDQQNIALTPFAEWFSGTYSYHATVAAAYVDVADGLSVVYKLPRDLQLKNETDLYTELKQAMDSGAPGFVIEEITADIARRKFADDPEKLRRYFIKTRFITFLGLPDAVFLQLAALGYMTAEERVLRTHSDSIFSELETTYSDFYDLAQDEQQRLVTEKAVAIVAKLGTAATGGFGRLNLTSPTIPAPEAPAVV